MKIRILLPVLVSALAGGGVDAQEVENPCVICPDGASAGDDTAPHAETGDPITCKELIEAARLFGAGTGWCAIYELEEFSCCPPVSPPVDPCTVCPNGVTVGDDVAPFDYGWGPMTCSELISFYNVSFESDSASCTYMVETFAPICCPTVPENPCTSICPDGASAGDDLAPYAEGGFLLTCKELIELDALYEAGSQERHIAAPPHPRIPATYVRVVPLPVMISSRFRDIPIIVWS
jgi:hypothetical protein